MRGLAAAGYALVALMPLVFLFIGAGRPTPYHELQLLAITGGILLVGGVSTGRSAVLASGFGLAGLSRLLQVTMGLSRLPVWLNVLLVAGWAWATVAAARGSLRPAAPLWLLGGVHALSLLWALSRLPAALGLAIGATGLLLAAAASAPHREADAARAAA